ncbi:2-phospho-L-lactate transferase [Novosphingobium rosa]|uniref:2-phospho-L-lactate transferase n=1 Tax=Novosphingobium rosa TaxID=76978 RepID=UPI00082CA28E|nr:2-phospho-L-lactate transferase [Novosphingobium rosa]
MSILAIAGGVGGAKLAAGLAQALPEGALTVAVNTGDDFEHMGLTICPDLDSVTYALAGLNNREQGWGVTGESWAFMEMTRKLGGEGWFNLGDRDLATHVLRTQRLRQVSLSQVTAELTGALGIRQKVVPMSDDPVRTIIATDEGDLAFQDYFVRRQCKPVFHAMRFDGAEKARISEGFAQALADPALEAIIFCPSNPMLSIEPVLSVPGVRDALAARRVPAVALSPFIAGQAVKGPAAKIMGELGLGTTPAALAACYTGLIDGLMVDKADDGPIEGIITRASDTLMRDDADQIRVAREMLAFAQDLAR